MPLETTTGVSCPRLGVVSPIYIMIVYGMGTYFLLTLEHRLLLNCSKAVLLLVIVKPSVAQPGIEEAPKYPVRSSSTTAMGREFHA